jgi:hypothetical protein
MAHDFPGEREISLGSFADANAVSRISKINRNKIK